MATALHLVVRFLHVLGMAVLLGGALLAWYAVRAVPRESLPVATGYEWVFWASLGVMVVTGVGNLGAAGVPAPATRPGTILTAKLLSVLAVVVGSFLRTLVVLELRAHADPRLADAVLLRRLYAVTAGALLVVVALAEVLAHG
jgi:uncharacterized membrane protein